MKKAAIITISVLFAFFFSLILSVFVFFALTPEWGSREEIEKDLLKITHIGTGINDVTSALAKSNFQIERVGTISKDVWRTDEQLHSSRSYLDNSYTAIGEKTIRFAFEQRWFDHACAYYAFDKNDELIDIHVYIETDML
jgi:hypothetical protein